MIYTLGFSFKIYYFIGSIQKQIRSHEIEEK